MSDDPSTALFEDVEPRRSRPGFFLTLLAAVALAFAVFAVLRNHSLENRLDALVVQTDAINAAQAALRDDLKALADREAQFDTETGKQIETLLSLSRDVAALETTTAALQDRAALPQRSWARAEALALLELAARQLKVERNIDAATEAMATADARLAQLREPAFNTVRRQLNVELQALQAFPRPDLAGITAQLRQAETKAGGLATSGIYVGEQTASDTPAAGSGAFDRAWKLVKRAFGNLLVVRNTAGTSSAFVTQAEQSLKRQRLQLLLLEARVAVTRADQPAFSAALASARSWLDDNFDAADAGVATLAMELEQLARTDIAPKLPDVAGSLRLLEQLVPLTRPAA